MQLQRLGIGGGNLAGFLTGTFGKGGGGSDGGNDGGENDGGSMLKSWSEESSSVEAAQGKGGGKYDGGPEFESEGDVECSFRLCLGSKHENLLLFEFSSGQLIGASLVV